MLATTTEPIVIIDDDKSIRRTLKLHFERLGHPVQTVACGQEGMKALDDHERAIVILDLNLPDGNGLDLLEEIAAKGRNYYTIMITAFPDMDSTLMAVKRGVGEFIHKPIDIDELDAAVRKGDDILSSREQRDTSYLPVPEVNGGKRQFVCKSMIWKDLFKKIGMVSLSRTTVHISGESGTGKELVAKAIHNSSADSNEPFISINCSAIVDTLLESELFGHEKGSFTGAVARKEGKFALAENGTIFLDEIGELGFNVQAKLLRVLQEREYEMVGGKRSIKTNCRVISATNKNLADMVEEGTFREDLFYRIKGVSIHLPPLRERIEDIPDLALYFVAQNSHKIQRRIRHISREAIDLLMNHHWTGNVRQLENVITNAIIMARDDKLTTDCFLPLLRPDLAWTPPSNGDQRRPAIAPPSGPSAYVPRSLEEVEKEEIGQALIHTKWHKGKACDILGLTRPRLERKIKKYGLAKLRSQVVQESRTQAS